MNDSAAICCQPFPEMALLLHVLSHDVRFRPLYILCPYMKRNLFSLQKLSYALVPWSLALSHSWTVGQAVLPSRTQDADASS